MLSFCLKTIPWLTLSFIISATAYADPKGGVVVVGSATIVENSNQLDIYQYSDKAIIDWDSFDINVGETTNIHQPTNNSILLNRITGSDPSKILGNITANGNVVLVNPNGIIFGPNSVVDVNGLIATTSNINNQDFMSGDLNFSEPGAASSFIINQGSITAKEAGLVALVAPNVANNGVITAKLGRVELASGNSFSVDLYGDGLYELTISDEVASQLISNTGSIIAEGGVVAVTAAAGQEIVNSLITIEGELRAPTIEQNAGKIIISAAGSNSVDGNLTEDKGHVNGYSRVMIGNAHLDASGRDAGEQGGEISITADAVGILANTVIDASGDASIALQDGSDGTATMTIDKTVVDEATFLASEYRAGGSIKIGGDYLGGGDTATSLYVYVDEEAYIINDAITSGDAGRTIIWSDDTTEFYGNVFARGGSEGGNGGFLETSGKEYLSALGYADLTAIEGYNKGTYLLDPANITIYGNVDPTFISSDASLDLNSNLQLWLDSADSSTVTLTYSTDDLSSATITGTSGTNTITTSLDVSASLAVGARIRIGASGVVTTADTLGTDTYTITSISGTTITVQETLTSNYSGTDLYRGLVSSWGDKSDNSYTAATTVEADMPLWIDGGLNGEDSIDFSGGANNLTLGSDYIFSNNDGLTAFSTLVADGNGSSVAEQFWFDFGFLSNSGYGFAHSSTEGLIYTPTSQGGDFEFVTYADVTSLDFENAAVIQTNSIIFNGTQTQSLNGVQMIDVAITGLNGLTGSTIAESATSETNSGPVTIGRTAKSGSTATRNFSGLINEVIIYDEELSDDATALVEQYQAAKWDIELDSGGTGSTEAERAMAAAGYSVFTTDYLERLSATADIILQADDSITLDLQGDTLSLDTDRSITLRTTTGDITDVSSGTITTNQTGTGGNITIDAGGSIDLDTTNLEALNGGVVNLMAVDTIDVSQTSTLTLGTLSSSTDEAITLSSTNDITFNTALTLQETLTATAGGSMTLNAGISTTENMTLQANDSITLDLNGNTLSLSDDASITLKTITGDITDVSSGTITTNQTTTGGNITIDAGGSIDLDTTNLEALNGGVVNLLAGSNLTSGEIDVAQTSDLNLGTLNSSTDEAITLSSTNDITFNTALTLQETLTATAGGSMTLNAGISTTENMTLQANDSITLDLDGNTLSLSDDASITLKTITGDITDTSSGTITTTQTGTGGNITIDAGADISLDTTNLNALSGGVVNLLAGSNLASGEIDVSQTSTLNLNTLSSSTDEAITLSSSGDIIFNTALTLQEVLTATAGGDITLTENISTTEDISLQANDSITLDLNGNTISLTDDASITLTTVTGDITDASNSTLETTQTGTGGNITIDAGKDISLDTTNLNALSGGVVNLLAGSNLASGEIDVSQTDTLNLGTLNSSTNEAITLSSTNDITFNKALTLQEALTATATGNIILNADITTSSALANAIQLSSASNFINNAGSDALNALNSSWVVYSNDFSGNTRDGLLPDESLFGQTNINAAISTATANKNIFAYTSTTQPTLTYTVQDNSVVAGNALTGITINYTSGLETGDTEGAIGSSGEVDLNTSYTTNTSEGFYSNALEATTGTLSNVLGYQYTFVAGDLTVTASAPTPTPTTPEVETPTPTTPEVETPTPTTPEVETPTPTTPEVETPTPTTPEVEVPNTFLQESQNTNSLQPIKTTVYSLVSTDNENNITIKAVLIDEKVVSNITFVSNTVEKELPETSINDKNDTPVQQADTSSNTNSVFDLTKPENKVTSNIPSLPKAESSPSLKVDVKNPPLLAKNELLSTDAKEFKQTQIENNSNSLSVASVKQPITVTKPSSINRMKTTERWYDGLLSLLMYAGMLLGSAVTFLRLFIVLFKQK